MCFNLLEILRYINKKIKDWMKKKKNNKEVFINKNPLENDP